MSRPMMSTGTLDVSGEKSPRRPDKQRTLHLLCLGDFSGNGQPAGSVLDGLDARQFHAADRDDIDDLFRKMDVRLDSPLADEPIVFREFDQLHPDYLFDELPIFARFRALKRKLSKRETFDEAAREVLSWRSAHEPQRAVKGTGDAGAGNLHAADDRDLLSQILGRASEAANKETFDVQALVRQIVSPYLEEAISAEQKAMIASVDQATSDLMRKLMHKGEFPAIESAWRGLDFLLRRIEDDARIKVTVFNLGVAELTAMVGDHFEEARDRLVQKILDHEQTHGVSFDMMIADYRISATEEGVGVARFLGALGRGTGRALVCGGAEQLAGCPSLCGYPDPEDWTVSMPADVKTAWEAFRASTDSQFVSILCPRYLQRLPYGRKTAATEGFSFKELPVQGAHEFYTWGNGAWLAAVAIQRQFVRYGGIDGQGVFEVDRLPLHVFTDYEGEQAVVPCAETVLRDRAAKKLADAGLTVIRSIANKDAVQIPGIFNAHATRSPLFS